MGAARRNCPGFLPAAALTLSRGKPATAALRACAQQPAASSAEYDVIVVGSGLGGLCAGALLSAAYDHSVLVLEANASPGGAAHSFKRRTPAGTFTFHAGPHLFSGLSGGLSSNPLQHVLRAARADVPVTPYPTWGVLLPTSVHSTRVTRGEPFLDGLAREAGGPRAPTDLASLLREMEPMCAAATAVPPAAICPSDLPRSLRLVLESLFARSRRIPTGPADVLGMVRSSPTLMKPFQPVLDAHVSDQFAKRFVDLLCFLLAGVRADKIPVAEVAFMFSEWTGRTAETDDAGGAVLEQPVGGASGIVSGLVDAIRRDGVSHVRMNSAVEEILVEDAGLGRKRVTGVRIAGGEEVRAKKGVISNLSDWDLPKLLPHLAKERKRIHTRDQRTGAADSGLVPLPSFLHLNLAFEITNDFAASLPAPLEPNYVHVRDWSMPIDAPQNVVLLSIPSVYDDSLAPPNHVVLHAYAPSTEPYQLWEGLNKDDYAALKEERFQFLWDAVDRVIPNARQTACIKMEGTPLTHERFLNIHKGTYGPETDASKGLVAVLPGQVRDDIAEGLRCVGGTAFPGIGVPAVAASAWLAANSFVDASTHRAVMKRVGLI